MSQGSRNPVGGHQPSERPESSASPLGPDAARTLPDAPRTLQSAEIFAGTREVAIIHEGDTYRLRRTSKGKLILTK